MPSCQHVIRMQRIGVRVLRLRSKVSANLIYCIINARNLSFSVFLLKVFVVCFLIHFNSRLHRILFLSKRISKLRIRKIYIFYISVAVCNTVSVYICRVNQRVIKIRHCIPCDRICNRSCSDEVIHSRYHIFCSIHALADIIKHAFPLCF